MAAEAAKSRSKVYSLAIVIFLAVLSLLYYLSAPVYLYIVAYLWFGFAIGGLMQYGRFCFASSWRDMLSIKVPRMFVGVVLAVAALSVVGAIALTVYPTQYAFPPLGLNELAGGAIFGLGMVLAGGCASGVLYKTGEGNLSTGIALLTFTFSLVFAASVIFTPVDNAFQSIAAHTTTWLYHPSTSMSQMIFGGDGKNYSLGQHLFADTLINSVLFGLVLLGAAYVLVVRKGFLKKRARELAKVEAVTANADGGGIKTGFKDELAGIWSMVVSSKRTAIVGLLIGVVAGSQIFLMSWMANHYDFGATQNFGNVLAGQPNNLPSGSTRVNNSGTTVPASWPANTYRAETSAKGTIFDQQYWVMASQLTMAGGWIVNKAGVNLSNVSYFQSHGLPSPWHNPLLLLSLGLLLGSAAMALFSREFKWKKPDKESATFAIAGGAVMGVGASIGFGCNIGAFFTRAAFGNPGGWLFFLAMGGGAFGGVKFINWWTERKMADMDFDIDIEL